jgi:ubiquinone/menaquinone biosynthesis C-methylase UbiE
VKGHINFLEWDIYTWGRGLALWEHLAKERSLFQKKGLEIGGRNGGVTLFFVSTFDSKMVCSDLGGPSVKAKQLHQKNGLNGKVSYADVNALDISFEDGSFDFVVFKSVLGSLANGKFENQQKAINEMHRVLKPGGVLFFAENLKASQLHQLGRKYFIPWGTRWRYISKKEMISTLDSFSLKEIKYTGFFAAFIPNKFTFLKNLFSKIDNVINPILPNSWKYVVYGYAIK